MLIRIAQGIIICNKTGGAESAPPDHLRLKKSLALKGLSKLFDTYPGVNVGVWRSNI